MIREPAGFTRESKYKSSHTGFILFAGTTEILTYLID
jgi:hypothetical protein